MIKILPLDILVASHRIPWKNKNAVYRFQIASLVLEIFVFEKNVKYANEMSDDVIYSTQYYMMYTNRAILINLHPNNQTTHSQAPLSKVDKRRPWEQPRYQKLYFCQFC